MNSNGQVLYDFVVTFGSDGKYWFIPDDIFRRIYEEVDNG